MIKFQVLEWDEYKDENGDGEEEYGLRLFGKYYPTSALYWYAKCYYN